MAWLKSHKWVLTPISRMERRHLLDVVRERHHTCMVFQKRYYDSDTGKFDSDSIETIASYSLGDYVNDAVHNNMHYGEIPQHRYERGYIDDRIGNFVGKFIHPDDDFDEECRLEEDKRRKEKQRLAEEKRRQDNIISERIRFEMEELARQKKESEERLRRYEEEYSRILADAEERKFNEQVRMLYNQPSGSNICSIRPNTWRPK